MIQYKLKYILVTAHFQIFTKICTLKIKFKPINLYCNSFNSFYNLKKYIKF